MVVAAGFRLPIHLSLALAVGVLLLGWFAFLAVAVWTSRARLPAPGAPTLDPPGQEPPAVVNLLCTRVELTAAAATATLVDLAARRVLEFEQYGQDTVIRVRVRSPEGLSPPLTPYEQQVFEQVTALASGGRLPAAALVTEYRWYWWKRFRDAVVAQAREAGLVGDRWSGRTREWLYRTAVAPVLLLCVAMLIPPYGIDSNEWSARVGLQIPTMSAGLLALFTILRKLNEKERATPAGLAVAARWLGYRDQVGRDESFAGLPPAAVAIWDRHLAYAAALGIARVVSRVLPIGPSSLTRVWSAYGGEWHELRIRYPRGSWGWSPWRALRRGCGYLLAGGAGGYALLRYHADLRERVPPGHWTEWFDRLYWLPVTLAALLVLRGLTHLVRAAADHPYRHAVVGEVVRTNQRQVRAGDHPRWAYWAAVDTGTPGRVRALGLTAGQYGSVSQGDLVRAVAGPYLGRTYSIRVLRAAVAPAAPAEGVINAELSPEGGG